MEHERQTLMANEKEMEKGVQRWFVDISKWNPPPQEFSLALSLLPQHEHSSITRYVKMDDKKRALVSRMLQYAIIHLVLGIPLSEIVIRRTVEGKPYLVSGKLHSKFPNFNFNVSHHGDYVAIASEPVCLVGLDVMSPYLPANETVSGFIQSLSSYFSDLEQHNIMKAGSSHDILAEFCRYWCLKEAFGKALGTGLGYQPDKVEFHHSNWENISVQIDGRRMEEWKFWLSDLGKGHMVSITRGHPRSATESYRQTLNRVDFSDDEYSMGLNLPNADFIMQPVEQLFQVLHTASGHV